MLVQIDNREQDRIKTAKEYYKSQGLEVEICELEIGDYLFDNQVVFEFKTISDFVSSIQNGKIFNQAINQSENYDYHYVIIQGDEHARAKALSISKHYQEVSYFGYLGAIASLNRYTTVIESYSPFIQEAYYRMLIQARKCIQKKPIVKKFPRKDKNVCFNYLAYCVYGISGKKAQKIVDELKIKTLEDLLYLEHDKLTSVEGIGEKLADRIIDTIQSETYEI
jgi:DNA excision repair protein ERCC-4